MMAYNTVKICLIITFLNSMQCITSWNEEPPDFYVDAINIKKALNLGRIWHQKAIINLLVERSNVQRQKILKAFYNIYEMSLIKELKRVFCGPDTADALIAMFIPQPKFYAYQLNEAIVGIGTDERAISEIIGSMDSAEILNVSAVYENEFDNTLEEDLITDTSGSYKELLVSLCDAVRVNSSAVDQFDTTIMDAYFLYKTSELLELKDSGVSTFINIFTTRSFSQLKLAVDFYALITNKTILQTIEDSFPKDLQYGLSVIVKRALVNSEVEFYANQLEESMAGWGTDDERLTRIIVGRSEIDLNEIIQSYKNIYGTELIDRVASDTSGNFGYLMLALIRKSSFDSQEKNAVKPI